MKEIFVEDFIVKMTDLLDTEIEISSETILSDIEEWDSLSFVAFLAMGNASYNKRISPDDVKSAKTIGDLYNLVK
jgi:acyl carrier protein